MLRLRAAAPLGALQSTRKVFRVHELGERDTLAPFVAPDAGAAARLGKPPIEGAPVESASLRLSDSRARPSRRQRLLQLRAAQPSLFRGFGMMPLAPLDANIVVDENLRALLAKADLADDDGDRAKSPREPRARGARGDESKRTQVADFMRRVHDARGPTTEHRRRRREPSARSCARARRCRCCASATDDASSSSRAATRRQATCARRDARASP